MNSIGQWFSSVFIQRYLGRVDSLSAIVSNIGWLVIDNALRMFLGVLVGAWVARYLGPAQFGELAYVVAFVSVFQSIAKLGLDSIVIRDIARDSNTASLILGTALKLRLIAGIVCWAGATGGMALLRPGDTVSLLLTAIVASTVLLQCADTVDLWFQSQLQSRRTVLARGSAYLVGSMIKVVLILSGAPLIAFAVMMVAEATLAASGLLWAYRWYPAQRGWGWRHELARQLLKESWALLLSGIAILLYMRIDQIMLREMVNTYELGIYSAALPLSTACYFIPVAICASVAPSIAKKKIHSEAHYLITLERLFSMMWWYSLPLCIVVSILAKPLIGLLYGESYSSSAIVLTIHVFSNIPVALGVAQSQWIANESRSIVALHKTSMGALSNVLLNFYLIPKYGAKGAAVATVVSFFISAVFSNLLFAPSILRSQIRSLVRYA